MTKHGQGVVGIRFVEVFVGDEEVAGDGAHHAQHLRVRHASRFDGVCDHLQAHLRVGIVCGDRRRLDRGAHGG
jgi:hypothetical protein